MIEAIPNVSEGRRGDVIAHLAGAVQRVAGVLLLDLHSDRSHHRSVLTLAGESGPLRAAMLALVEQAIRRIDLRSHAGVHPRIGAVDVMPFVPLEGSSMADCVSLAGDTGAEIAQRFELPVFLYGEASRIPGRRRLEDVRRGQFEGLAARMAGPDWHPDFGPSRPHPTAGAVAIGARLPLIAFNVNLETSQLDVAQRIAKAVRESSGGLPCVKAMGVLVADARTAQVSMNLTDFRVTSVRTAFDAVAAAATALGVRVSRSELVGLAPAASLSAADARHVKLTGFSDDEILEVRIRRVAAGGYAVRLPS